MPEIVNCKRCQAHCQVDALRSSNAKMLRRSKEPAGLCVNCAVHDWLRNTYPPNMLLAKSGPKILLYPHIQEQFTEIMRVACADARPAEINWDLIVDNWDLPFPHKIKPGPANPCSQLELDEIASGKRPGIGYVGPVTPDPLGGKMVITSFEELNLLKPGLGDQFKKCINKTR